MITGTFLDEISFDIPHHNWGIEEWDKDFRAMKAMGIKRVIEIRCAHRNFMTYDSKVIPRINSRYVMHKPPIDLVDMFLTLAEKHGMEFYFGTMHCHDTPTREWLDPAIYDEEARWNQEIIREVWGRYGDRKAFAGWYLTHEVSRNHPGTIDLFLRQGGFAKEISGGKPTLISPGFSCGVKSAGPQRLKPARTMEEMFEDWEHIFSRLTGVLDYVAFQDGHVEFDQLIKCHQGIHALGERYGIDTWTNIESFDRDMPIAFLPIKWEKFLWKIEAAQAAGIKDGITLEFSHFMSPNSMYGSAHGLYDRYCEYFGIPARSKDFKD